MSQKEKTILLIELIGIALLFTINKFFFSAVQYSSQVTLVISLVLITFFLRRRKSSWKILGLKTPEKWWKAIIYFILCVATIAVVFNFVIQPLFPHGANEISQGRTISFGEMLFQLIVIGIGTAAIGEEMLFRGYLLNTINQLIGKNVWGTVAAVLIQAFIFGILHSGMQGMISAGVIGLILGIFYLLSGRNLIVVMAAHAVPDILSIIGSYQNQ
ncbi:MAG: CPBP family intramembrane metalloprotease [Cyclobacteriaceae bacterium]|nr:CPBP family intramembrane metalloprotease [Cyclobacteriaceae bacterium]